MPFDEERILDANLEWFGFSVLQAMENAGKAVADEVKRRYAPKAAGVFCGLGNKGGDGFVAARFLSRHCDVAVYLVGKPQDIQSREALKNFELLKYTDVEVVVAADSRELPDLTQKKFDVVIDALVGTGLEGELKEPTKSVVGALNALKAHKVAVDVPSGFGSSLCFGDDLTISMNSAKKKGALVADVGIPQKLGELVGPGQAKALTKPEKRSHKGENGILTVIGGSKQYHGAPITAVKAASKFVDLVYFHSPEKEGNKLVKQLRLATADIIVVDAKQVEKAIQNSDCVLVGPGLEENDKNKKLLDSLLTKHADKKFVLDAGALKLLDKRLLGPNVCVTPHAKEFEDLFKQEANEKNAKQMAKQFNCVVCLKGAVDVISDGSKAMKNLTGNEGMTKGGTGDCLAGLMVALACKNSLFLAAQAACFVNGFAGDLLKKEKGNNYSASDLVEKLPDAYNKCTT